MAIHPGTGLDHGGLPPAPPLNRSGHPVASGPLTLTRSDFYYFVLLTQGGLPHAHMFLPSRESWNHKRDTVSVLQDPHNLRIRGNPYLGS